jgi:RNA methyltransferase, TrmH family
MFWLSILNHRILAVDKESYPMNQPLKPLSFYKELVSSSHARRESGFFLIEGWRAVSQIAAGHGEAIEEILTVESESGRVSSFDKPVRILTDRQIASICSSKTPQGIAAVVRIPEKSFSAELPKNPGRHILLLEGVQDPGNTGTLIRTAAAFDYDGVIMSETTADPFSPKALQATAGSVLSLWIRRTARYLDIVKDLKSKRFRIVAADLQGEPLKEGPAGHSFVLALGSEGNGLTESILNLADQKIRIPMNSDKAESLNVAVSGGILMFSISRGP